MMCHQTFCHAVYDMSCGIWQTGRHDLWCGKDKLANERFAASRYRHQRSSRRGLAHDRGTMLFEIDPDLEPQAFPAILV